MTIHRQPRKSALMGFTEGEKREYKRKYFREYYQLHKEKAKEYQALYNLAHKKKLRVPDAKGKNHVDMPRPKVRVFKPLDIQSLDPIKIVEHWNRIAV